MSGFKFEKFEDMTSWMRTLHEDDWNDGKQYVLKTKNVVGAHTFSTTTKVGEKAGDKPHGLDVELKSVSSFQSPWADKEGVKFEGKFKNDGSVQWETRCGMIQVSQC